MKVIHVDYDSRELGKTHPSDLLIPADVAETVRALSAELRAPPYAAQHERWRERSERVARETAERRRRVLEQHRASWDVCPVRPHRLMAEIAAALPAEAAVFDEAITSGVSLELYLRPSEPWRYFRARGGGLGAGLPGALGLRAAMPQQPVVGVVADGAALYSLTALWTAAHHRLPVTYVICNNGGYRVLKMNLREYRGAADAGRPAPHLELTDPEIRFDRVAQDLGVPGIRVEHSDEIGPALREAIAAEGPRLVDVVLDSAP